MTTREDVVSAIEAVDARVDALTPRLVAHGDARLPEGEWHVREALCHLAARANSVPVAVAAAERARARAQGDLTAASGFTEIDEVNRRQIEERRDRTIPELLQEIHDGHQDALEAVKGFAHQALDERWVVVPGRGEWSFAELLLRAGPGHENNHLDAIEKAIGQRE